MLKGRDEHEPRVHPEVWKFVNVHHRAKYNFHATADPQKDINVGDDDAASLMRSQDDRRRLKVIREAWYERWLVALRMGYIGQPKRAGEHHAMQR